MSKFWKWTLGILLALALFASGVFAGSMVRAHKIFARHAPMFVMGEEYLELPAGDEIRILPAGGPSGYTVTESYGPSGKFHGNMHRGGSEYGLGLFHILGGLLHLAIFFGLIYGAYWLGRRNARLVLDPKADAPKAAASARAGKPAPRTRARRG